MDWVQSLNGAIGYIEANLRGSLSCEEIAASVYRSSAHFQRMFAAMTGLTVGEYARNRRMTLAGHALASGKAKVVDVALSYGYESPEGFSKAFARFHGVAPSRAARGGPLRSLDRLLVKVVMEGGKIMEYRIERAEAFEAVVKATRIEYERAGTDCTACWGAYFGAGHQRAVPGDYGFCGPAEPGEDFWYAIGCERSRADGVPEGFEVWEIPKGEWAVFRCVGAMPDAIKDMWKRIFEEWLPLSSYEIAPGVCDFERYFEGDPDSEDYVSEIWLPVQAK